jgi:hypothetical protein
MEEMLGNVAGARQIFEVSRLLVFFWGGFDVHEIELFLFYSDGWNGNQMIMVGPASSSWSSATTRLAPYPFHSQPNLANADTNRILCYI